jgi:hypothetical protein
MTIALLLTFAAAVVVAWILASKRPEHRSVALLLSFGLIADAGLCVFDAAVLAPLRASLGTATPWTGWARAAGFLADAVTLVWPAAILAAVLVVFAGRKPWPALAGWACVLVVLAVAHPIAGDGSQARALALANTLAIMASAGIVLAWYRKTTEPAGSARLALALIVSAEAVSLLGAWRVGPFERWPVAQALYLALFGALVLAQGRFLWSSPQPSS